MSIPSILESQLDFPAPFRTIVCCSQALCLLLEALSRSLLPLKQHCLSLPWAIPVTPSHCICPFSRVYFPGHDGAWTTAAQPGQVQHTHLGLLLILYLGPAVGHGIDHLYLVTVLSPFWLKAKGARLLENLSVASQSPSQPSHFCFPRVFLSLLDTLTCLSVSVTY